MAFIKITEFQCSPKAISSGDDLKITYKINGNNGVDIKITYSLDDDNNIFFKTDSGNKKTIGPEDKKLSAPPMAVDKTVTIVKVPPAEGEDDFDHFDITADVTDNVTSDDSSCTIKI